MIYSQATFTAYSLACRLYEGVRHPSGWPMHFVAAVAADKCVHEPAAIVAMLWEARQRGLLAAEDVCRYGWGRHASSSVRACRRLDGEGDVAFAARLAAHHGGTEGAIAWLETELDCTFFVRRFPEGWVESREPVRALLRLLLKDATGNALCHGRKWAPLVREWGRRR